MIKEPIYQGLLQSDLDFAGFNPINLDGWPPTGGSGTGLPPGWVNVKDPPYNAVGDGVADDTVAIQSALNYLHTIPGGGTVFFPPGTYLCNGNFDPVTNSILKIPYNSLSDYSQTITLCGQDGAGMTNAVIITARTDGTGLYPALLAANECVGIAADALTGGYFSNVTVVIRDLIFATNQSGYSPLSGIRLDTVSKARLRNVAINGGPLSSTAPPYDNVGLWMPNSGNFSECYADNIVCSTFKTGCFIADHVVGTNLYMYQVVVGIGTLVGYHINQVNFNSYFNPIAIQNRGNHCPVDFCARIEDMDPRVGYAWQQLDKHVDDPANTLWGTMNYTHIREPDPTRIHPEIILNGAANLHLRNLFTANDGWLRLDPNTMPANPTEGQMACGLDHHVYSYLNGVWKPLDIVSTDPVYVGTDARLVSITGGAKLEVRNPGTGLWANADQWTNP